jgi:hypothetical protein
MTTLTPEHLDAGSGTGEMDEPSAVASRPPYGPISPELVLVDPELARLLRTASPPAGREPTVGAIDGPVSPELVLVDPELARLLRTASPTAGPEPPVGATILEPAPEESLVSRQDAAVVLQPVERASVDREPATAPRDLGKRVARVAAMVAAALVIGAAGAALGDLFASAPDSASRDTRAPEPASSAAPSADATVDSTAPTGTGGEGGTPRTMAWAPAAGAAAYDVALYSGSRRIFLERTNQTRLVLPAEWSYGGRRLSLEPGVYRWYVWPVKAGARQAESRPVVQASLTVPAS